MSHVFQFIKSMVLQSFKHRQKDKEVIYRAQLGSPIDFASSVDQTDEPEMYGANRRRPLPFASIAIPQSI